MHKTVVKIKQSGKNTLLEASHKRELSGLTSKKLKRQIFFKMTKQSYQDLIPPKGNCFLS